MSDETLVPEQPAVEPVVAPEVPVVESAVEPELPVVPVVENPAVTLGVQPDKTVVMYNGQAVKLRQGTFDADGAELCELADGSTTYVPKSVLGA